MAARRLSVPDPPLRIVPMQRTHLEEVLRIEREAYPTPWSADAFLHEMERNPFARCEVALEEGRVCGQVCIWLIYGELRINNLAVAEEHRGRGLGEALARWALDSGRASGCRIATLEVRPSNTAALALYRKLDFEVTGRRPRYYSDNGEDALLMSRRLGPSDVDVLA